jgi:hypothetical protein
MALIRGLSTTMAGTDQRHPNPGVTVARAKRTTRAEARRRYRAEHGLSDETTADDETQDAGASESGGPRATRPQPGQPERLGIATAFRLAFRPLDLRGDIRALPQVATRSKALWLPILLTLGATAIFLVARPQPTGQGDLMAVLATFLFQYFIQTPAIGGVFIAGFLAPRASWLLGIIVGIVSAACYAALILSGVLGIATTTSINEVILAAFLVSPVMGTLFASAAAWYRRFLQLSSPNRGRNRQPPRRGNDGRSRSTSGQKAGARR